jgi:hypothetical protein
MHKVTTHPPPKAFTAWLISRLHHDKSSDILGEQSARRG